VVYFRKILITTDMSDFSLAAMEYAASFGLLYTARLYLLHVLERPPGGTNVMGGMLTGGPRRSWQSRKEPRS